MITAEIQFHAPRRLDEALALLAKFGDEAKVLAGGMSLVPTMNLGLARPEVVVSLNHVTDLSAIDEVGGAIRIQAGVRHVDVIASPLVQRHCAVLGEAAGHIGDVQVRNRGTIGGSAAHADPAADYLPVLVVLDASIVVRNSARERVIPAAEFFVDIMQTALQPDELLTEIRIPKQAAGSRGAYRRLARVEGSFAIVNAAAVITAGGDSSLAIGGVAARPVVVDVAEAVRGGLDEAGLAAVADAVRLACAEPYEDLNGNAEYRREMAVVYARRALLAAAGRG